MQIRFILRHIQFMATSVFRSEQFIFGVKMLGGQKFVSYTEAQSVVLQRHGQQSASFFCIRDLEVC